MDGSRLSLVLPAYNEEAGIRQAIVEADEALRRLCTEYEILVVDDGSRDQTAKIARDEARLRPNVRVLQHTVNRGYGAALRTGFEAARYDLTAFTDADCQFHLDDLSLMLPLTQTHSVVVGYRVDRKDPWRRKFLSRGFNLIAHTLLGTGVRDVDCALKVFRRDALMQILPETQGFFVNTEMLTRAGQLGFDVAEVGVRHRPRVRGQSTVSLREVPRILGRLLPFWWSQVLFAGKRDDSSEPTPVQERSTSTLMTHLLLLVLITSLLFFSRLRAPLLEPQEGRYAAIPREMLEHQQWLVPTLNGLPYLDKPPLLYWAVMGSYQLFGVRDTSARLVPGLAALLLVLVSYLWGRRVVGASAGLCGALVLCAMPQFVYRGRMLTFDILLALWVVSALAAGHLALMSDRRRTAWWILSALACGLGLLTKGPVALVLVAVPLFAVACLDPRLHRPRLRDWCVYLTVSVGVAAPWYTMIMLREPTFAHYFFWKHHVERFVAPFDHSRPVWYYLPGLVVGLLPWSLLAPGLCRRMMDRSAEAGRERPSGLGLFVLSATWVLLFFSLAGSKRPTYLLPAFPGVALVVGWYLRRGVVSLWERVNLTATVSAWLILASAATLITLSQVLEVGRSSTAMPVMIALCVAGGLLLIVRRQVNWSMTTALVLVGLFLGVQHLLPGYNAFFSVRGQLRRMCRSTDRPQPIVCYPQRFDSLSFYLPNRPVKVYGPAQREQMIAYLQSHPDTLLLIKGGTMLEQLRTDLPPSVTLQTTGERAAVVVGRVVTRRPKMDRWLAERR